MQNEMNRKECLVPARIDQELDDNHDDFEIEILNDDDAIRIVAALNPFSTEKVESFAPCGLTISQIVGSKCPENVEVWVNGVHIERDEWSEYIPEPRSLVNIKVLPGKGVLRAILLLAVVVASILLANFFTPEIAGLLDISSKLGLEVIKGTLIAVFSAAGFLLVNTLIPPSVPDQESFERIGSLTGARNRIGAFTPIPRLYGKMKYFPPVPMTGTPYTEIVGNYTYLRALFVLGYGPLDIAGLKAGGGSKLTLKDNPQIASEIFIGETQIDNFEDVELEIGEHTDITLYTNSVFQENLNVALNSTAQQPQQTVSDNVSEIRTTQIDTEEIIVDIEFPSGLFSIDKKGKNVVSTVTFKFEYRLAGTTDPWTNAFTQQNVNEPGSHNFWYDSWLGSVTNEIATEVPNSNTYPNMVVRSSERKTVRRSFRWKVPKGQYEVKVTRVETYNEGKTIGSTDAVWTNLKSVKTTKPFVLDNVVLMALRIKATDEITGVLDNVSVKATSRLLAWDGTSWTEKTTRNPAWAYVDILSGNATRTPIDKDTEIDKSAILDWANWCDANGFYYDRVLDSTGTVFDRIREVTAAGRASWSFQDNLFSVIREETNQTPLQVFTPRNTSELRYEKLFPDIPHAFRVKFVDPTTYEDTERFVYDDGYDSTNATKFQELPLPGVTDPNQAWKLGRFHLAQLRLRPERYTFNVPLENIIVQRGDAAMIQHDVLLVGLAAGRIKSVTRDINNNITSFVSDQELLMDATKTYGIKIRYIDANGNLVIVQSQIQTVSPSTFTVTPTSPLPSDIKEGDLFIHGEFGKESIDVKILKIIPKDNLTAEITAVPLSPEILNADQGTIPPFNPVITKPVDPTTRVPPVPTIKNIQSDSKVLFRDIDGNLRARILITYDLVNEEGYSDIEIEARYSNSKTPQNWRYVKNKAEIREISIFDGIEEGDTYDIQLRSIRGNLSSRWTSIVQHTVIGKTDNPSDVVNFSATVSGFDILLSWDHIDDLDRKEYEIREGNDWATGTIIATTADNVLKITSDKQQTRTFWIKAIDTSGNYSVNATSTTANASTTTLPDDVIQYPVPNVVKGDNDFLKGKSPLVSSTGAGNFDLVSSKFPLGRLGVSEGTKAGLTIECYHTGGGTMSALLKFYDSSGVFINEGDDIRIIDSHSNTTGYQIARTWIKIPANATQVEVGARRTGGASGIFYVQRPMLHLGWVRPPIIPPNIQDAVDVPYVDGQTLEDLKPAEAGSTKGAPPGTNVGSTPSTSVEDGANRALTHIDSAGKAPSDLVYWIDEPSLTIQDLKPAEAGADKTFGVNGSVALTTADAGTWIRLLKSTGLNGRGGYVVVISNAGGGVPNMTLDVVCSIDWSGRPTITVKHVSRVQAIDRLRLVADAASGVAYLDVLIPSSVTSGATLNIEARSIPGAGTQSLVIDEVRGTTVPPGATVAEIGPPWGAIGAASDLGDANIAHDGSVHIGGIETLDLTGALKTKVAGTALVDTQTAATIRDWATRAGTGLDSAGLLAAGIHPLDRLVGNTAALNLIPNSLLRVSSAGWAVQNVSDGSVTSARVQDAPPSASTKYSFKATYTGFTAGATAQERMRIIAPKTEALGNEARIKSNTKHAIGFWIKCNQATTLSAKIDGSIGGSGAVQFQTVANTWQRVEAVVTTLGNTETASVSLFIGYDSRNGDPAPGDPFEIYVTDVYIAEGSLSPGAVIPVNDRADLISYVDGTVIDTLKPAEAGADNTGNRIGAVAQQLLPNWDFSVADSNGKPAGIKATQGISDESQLQFGGIGIQILSAPVSGVAYGFPAIPIDDQQKYRITIRHKSSAASASGLYLRMQELNTTLPAGKTHIAPTSVSNLTVAHTSEVRLVNNGPMPGTTVREDTYTYIPTPGTKFASFDMANWIGFSGTYEVEFVQIDIIPKDADQIPDGATKRITTLNEATGAGRAYNAIDSANKLQTGTTASATINATPASSVEDGAARATTAIQPNGILTSGIHPYDALVNIPDTTQNLVRKPHFEDGNYGLWQTGTSNTLSVVSVTGQPFSKALEIVSGGGWDAYENTLVSVQSGDTIYIEGWVDFSQSSVSGSVAVGIADANKSFFSWPGIFVPAGSGWTKYTGKITVPSGGVYIRPFIAAHMTSGDIIRIGPQYRGLIERAATLGAPTGTLVDTTLAETVRQGAEKANIGLDASGILASGIHPLDRLTNRTLDVISDGTTRKAVTAVDANGKALIDFTQAGHIGKGALATKNTVGTADIDDFAVSVIDGNFTSTAITFTSFETTIASVTIDTTNATKVDLTGAANLSYSKSEDGYPILRLKRGSTTLATYVTTRPRNTLDKWVVSVPAIDTAPPGGNVTYYLTVQGSSGQSGTATNRYIKALALKK